MECLPTDKLLVDKVAEPLLKFSVPRVVVPSRKVTEPVGVPPVPLTVAVNVTLVPLVDGLDEELSAGGRGGVGPDGNVEGSVRRFTELIGGTHRDRGAAGLAGSIFQREEFVVVGFPGKRSPNSGLSSIPRNRSENHYAGRPPRR